MSGLTLCAAIGERKRVSFRLRKIEFTVEPYSVGYPNPDDSAGGNPLTLRGISGGGWQDFEVKFMNNIQTMSETFEVNRTDYRPLSIVLCDVFGKVWR